MARVLWSEESNGTIHHLPDILTVYLAWSSSAKREVWKLDKEIVMGERAIDTHQTAAGLTRCRPVLDEECRVGSQRPCDAECGRG